MGDTACAYLAPLPFVGLECTGSEFPGCRSNLCLRISLEYADQTAQEIVSYQSCLTDRPEELYLALLEYFEPEEDEFSEDFDEDVPFS